MGFYWEKFSRGQKLAKFYGFIFANATFCEIWRDKWSRMRAFKYLNGISFCNINVFCQHGTLNFHANNDRSGKICPATIKFENFVCEICSFKENRDNTQHFCLRKVFWNLPEITKVNPKILSILVKTVKLYPAINQCCKNLPRNNHE